MEKKTILITGSNRGIGFEIARQCVRAKHRVIISGRDEGKISQAAQDLKNDNTSADTLLMDVSKPESIFHAAEDFHKRNIKLDVLINNAAIGFRQDRSLHQDQEETLLKILNTNSLGALRVTKAFLPFMNSPGRIIMISSGGGSMTDEPGRLVACLLRFENAAEFNHQTTCL